MKNIKQTLSEELNKMQFLLGYQRGMVISEQQLIREYDPNVAGTAAPKPSIRSIIEADIKKENLGLTWVQVKQSFGSTGQGSENQLLYKAWKGGWRPGKEVPAEFQTPTYKQKIVNGGTTTTTTTVAGQIEGSEQVNIKTPEDAQKAIADAEQKAKELKDQVRMDTESCRIVGRAINPIIPIKRGVTSPELCAKLWQCIDQGFINRGESAFIEACPKPVKQTPDASTTTTTTVAPSPVNKQVQRPNLTGD